MNTAQRLWWEQARADHKVLSLLREHGMGQCHQLHYFQMVTEKLSKAYFWRAGTAPGKSHAFFVSFLKALVSRGKADQERIAKVLGFGRASKLRSWVRRVITPLAYELEQLAPDLAGDNGPNTEYPWPHASPTTTPAGHDFAVWRALQGTANGRELLKFIDAAVAAFPHYA